MLNKQEFDALDKMKQLEYINKTILESGKTAKDICKEIGIALSTLSDRFKSIGYRFDRSLKQYTLIKKNEEPESHTEPSKEKSNSVTPINKSSVKNTVMAQIKPSEKLEGNNRKNSNIALDIDLKKRLQVYAIMHNKTLSDILNEAGEMYLKKFE